MSAPERPTSRRRFVVRDASACPDCGQAAQEQTWVAMCPSDFDGWRCRNGHTWATAWDVIRPTAHTEAAPATGGLTPEPIRADPYEFADDADANNDLYDEPVTGGLDANSPGLVDGNDQQGQS